MTTPFETHLAAALVATLPLLLGWLMDKALGDPEWMPHPVVWFGKAISLGERRLNRGSHRMAKGAALAIGLTILAYLLALAAVRLATGASTILGVAVKAVLVFYCLAGTTLLREVRAVFTALDSSLEKGRRQVARIVGRDTGDLSADEVKKAALETLAENLGDGVVAPLFWLCVAGVPGMVAYKMVNTLDSMIAYRTERFRKFGTFAARIDDAANYVPARLTALIMVAVNPRPHLAGFVARNGRRHASPNSGYPEAALAGMLDCRFGGGHRYFGEWVEKPFIGENDRALGSADLDAAAKTARATEAVAVILSLLVAAAASLA